MNSFFLLITLAVTASAASVSKPACGGSSSSKTIQLLNPSNPPRECSYKIKAYSSNVCQLRIDFAMVLAPPSLPGANNPLSYAKCIQDYFQVGALQLCGVETKQHVYVPLNRTAGVTSVDLSITLAVRLGNSGLPTPSWDILVTQLECPAGAAIRELDFIAPEEGEELKPSTRASIKDGFFVAPPGCLQYFPQSSGVVTSFNYNQDTGLYPGNLNYAICFRRQTQTQALQLKPLVFNLGGEHSYSKLDSQCYSAQHYDDISEDYLMIPQATIERSDTRATYFCGDSIDGQTVRSSNPGPLMMIFNSDRLFKQREAGFYIKYSVL